MNKCVFIDRDGTIIKDKNYISNPKDVELLPYSAEGIKLLKKNGFMIVVITNQSGIGRGYFTENDFYLVNQRMIELLNKKGIKIDNTYFCPHRPEDNCACRKPKNGMIENAVNELKINLKESYLIGDQKVDIELAKNVNIPGILVLTGHGEEDIRNCQPNYVAKNLLDAAKWIIMQRKKAKKQIAKESENCVRKSRKIWNKL